ncbi:MAG: M48 family metallopeptidase [Candidatus Ranarchaeia archaeon]|jgi:heat shock protein HtpX
MTIPSLQKELVEYFSITTELPFREAVLIPELLMKYYVKKEGRFRKFITSELKEQGGYKYLFFSVPHTTEGEWQKVDVMVSPGKPIKITMWKNDPSIPTKFLRSLFEDIIVMIQLIEEKFRQMSYYSMFLEGMPPLTKKIGGRHSGMLTDSQTTFFILAIIVSFGLFIIIPDYAIIITFPFIFLTSIFSGRLMTRGKPWTITKDNRIVYLVHIALVWEEYERIAASYQRARLEINQAIYNSTIALKLPVTSEAVNNACLDYGVQLPPESLIVREIDVFSLFEEVSTKYKMSIPKIVLAPTMTPNAAASGPNSRLGVVIITGGILFQLTEDELKSIIGHEMSHLKAHDPLVLISLTVGMLLPVYLGYLPIDNFLLFLIYYWLIMMITYLIGKFLEARSDLDSAMILQNSENLATGLRKIGFIRLLPLHRFVGRPRVSRMEWLSPDPHPPLAYRIDRLESMRLDKKVKHTFVASIRDVLSAIIRGT